MFEIIPVSEEEFLKIYPNQIEKTTEDESFRRHINIEYREKTIDDLCGRN